MAVIIDEFEASVDPGAEGSRPRAGGQPAMLKRYDLRRELRRTAVRAARLQWS
jgi:hypothetical protein